MIYSMRPEPGFTKKCTAIPGGNQPSGSSPGIIPGTSRKKE
jgi:hypothetical protein